MAIAETTFHLDPDFQGTLQKQIQGIVAEGILSGRFRPEEKLPSSRRLAEHLGVSRITVTLAYTELVADDYLSARGRSGYFVSATAPRKPDFDLPQTPHVDTVDWSRLIGTRFSSAPTITKPIDWRTYRYPFIYGQADATLFDHANWRLCALQALGHKDFEALTTDYHQRDDPKLIEFIVRNTLPRRGIIAHPDEVLVTLGAQNALWLTAQVLLTQRRTAVMENPCYPGLREILSQSRCNLVSVDVDQQGLVPSDIPASTDVVFTTPSHHCPTSATMPIERRRALLKRASTDSMVVVEDDYEFEMSHLKPTLPALKSLDREGRVIYIGSFSKPLFPGLRLGYLVGSAAFIREARALRATVLRHPPGHIQRTAAYFLSLGHYDAMIRRTGQAFLARRQVMEDALNEAGLEIAGRDVAGGSSIWMRAPEHIDTAVLAERLREDRVLIEPGAVFFNSYDTPKNYYRLGYSSISTKLISPGVALIAKALQALE